MPADVAITTADASARGYTPNELARLLRISPDRVRAMIASGELPAVDTARVRCGRPRYVVLPHHLAEWERRRRVSPPPKPAPRRRQPRRDGWIDFYPND